MEEIQYPRFGSYLKQLRMDRKLSLREFSRQSGMDAAYVSRVERGMITPPQLPEALQNVSKGLQMAKESPEWERLVDYSAVDNANIPDDLMRKRAVSSLLPAFFRVLRKKTEPELREFVKKLQQT